MKSNQGSWSKINVHETKSRAKIYFWHQRIKPSAQKHKEESLRWCWNTSKHKRQRSSQSKTIWGHNSANSAHLVGAISRWSSNPKPRKSTQSHQGACEEPPFKTLGQMKLKWRRYGRKRGGVIGFGTLRPPCQNWKDLWPHLIVKPNLTTGGVFHDPLASFHSKWVP